MKKSTDFKKNTPDKICMEISGKILSGEFKEKEKLPPERVMAEKYGVSNTKLRKALSELQKRGLVVKIPKVGNFVGKVSLDQKETRQDFLGVVLPMPGTHPYTIEVLKSLERHSSALGLMPVFRNSNEDIITERDSINDMIDKGIKNLIVNPAAGNRNINYFIRLKNLGVKIVFIGRRLDIQGIIHEGVDFRELTEKMTRDLIESGRKTGYLGIRYREGSVSTVRDREEGFLGSGDINNLSWVYADECENSKKISSAIEKLLQNGVNALALGSQKLLLALDKALKKHNLKIGKDIELAIHGVRDSFVDKKERFSIQERFMYALDENVNEMCARALKHINNQ